MAAWPRPARQPPIDQLPFYKNPAVHHRRAFNSADLHGRGVSCSSLGQTWSDDIKMMFVTAIVSGLLGSVTGFFLGSSLGSQKKDAALGAR
jgi:hypothetical protein